MYLGGAALMEHMKHVHKDPNASGVAGEQLFLTSRLLFMLTHYTLERHLCVTE